uniref:EGF-like domain-containing protein n=1 Tax=Globisporangium ultimum (strain ATCC 200006 / CBS 805.95 / DAOM BR144) TaxID=431595 RepID=K3W729_GLOUD
MVSLSPRWSMAAVLMVLALALMAHSSEAAAVDGVIRVRGNKMYNSKTGERFFIKGMTYEYAVSDTYYNQYSKAIIAKNLKGLNFNTLRVYNINPDESYKDFMTDMAALGVYVLVSASPDNDEYFGKYRYSTITKALGPDGKVTTSSNGVKTVDQTETCYPALLLEYGKKIAKNFAAYDNTLGIIVANEIMQVDLTAAACVKQYVADLKNWMRVNGKKMRIIPLAYAAADSSYAGKIDNADDYHVLKIQGLLCGDKMKDGSMQKSIDIYLINEYRWCPKSTFAQAYQRLINFAQGAPIALAFGEYGCKEDSAVARDWGMIPYYYGKPADTNKFSEVYSGGLAYSYGQAKLALDAKFPMFTGGSTDPLKQPSTVPSADYTNLKAQFDKYEPYSDPAGWSTTDKCTWSPTLATTTQASNTRATENGWIVDSCTASFLKVADTDTWVAKSREGITSSDCGVNGQCLTVNGEKACSCLTCYTGSDCSVKDISTCSTLSNSKDAPKIIFAGVGVFLVIMLVVFVALAVVAQKKKSAMDKLGDQVKLRNPGAASAQAQGAAL